MKSFLLLALIALASCLSGGWSKHSLAEDNIYIEGAFIESFKAYANDENVDPDNFVRLSVYSQVVNGNNYRVCFIDRNESLTIQEFIIYVPLQTSNKNEHCSALCLANASFCVAGGVHFESRRLPS